MPESDNVVGALIFFSYIAAALLLSSLLVADLWWLNKVRHYLSDKGSQHVTQPSSSTLWILVVLTGVSFTVLSYHMLTFLILSYVTWSRVNGIAVPESVLGPNSLLGLSGTRMKLHVWRWATTSTLFQTFAEVICGDPHNWLWTQSALLYSYAWNTYMAIQGHYLEIPMLWGYFLLDQVLPVSFTQFLFLIATQLVPVPRIEQRQQQPSDLWQVVPCLAYFGCLIAAPRCVGTTWFFPMLFVTRLLLFLRLVDLKPRNSTQQPRQHSSQFKKPAWKLSDYRSFLRVLGVGATLLTGLELYQIRSSKSAAAALNSNPAVSALGYDMLIGLAGLGIFLFTI